MTPAEARMILARNNAHPGINPSGQPVLGRTPNTLLTNPGNDAKLVAGATKSFSIEANDPLINEFSVVVSVEPPSFKVLSDELSPSGWGVRAMLRVDFDSANHKYYRPCNTESLLLVPITGMMIPVHGQRATIQFKRDENTDDAPILGEVVLMVSIVPRLPGSAPDVRNGSVSNAASYQEVAPAMARTVNFLTKVTAGDTLIFRDPGETIVFQTLVTADMVLKDIGMPKLAYKVEYFTVDLVAKPVSFNFTTWM